MTRLLLISNPQLIGYLKQCSASSSLNSHPFAHATISLNSHPKHRDHLNSLVLPQPLHRDTQTLLKTQNVHDTVHHLQQVRTLDPATSRTERRDTSHLQASRGRAPWFCLSRDATRSRCNRQESRVLQGLRV